MRYHLTPVRRAIIKKSTNNKYWRECGEKGAHLHCWWECKLTQPLWKTVWRFLKKLKIELPYDPIPGHISGENSNSKRYMCSNLHCSTIYNTWKQSKCSSTDEWIKKMWHIYIYTMEYYSAMRKSEIMLFAATWMGLEIIILSEVNQTEKDKYHRIHLCMESKK